MIITPENVTSEIAKFTQKDVAAIQADTKLKDLVAESFVLIEMIIELQETFDVRLNQNALAHVNTVGELTDTLKQLH